MTKLVNVCVLVVLCSATLLPGCLSEEGEGRVVDAQTVRQLPPEDATGRGPLIYSRDVCIDPETCQELTHPGGGQIDNELTCAEGTGKQNGVWYPAGSPVCK